VALRRAVARFWAGQPEFGQVSAPLVTLTLACAGRSALHGPIPHFIPPPPTEGNVSVANIKSQIKRNKQNEKRHQRNKAVKSELKTLVRRFREAADAGNTDAAVEAGRVATRKLDKAVSKGVIHKNQAANRKSAIMKRAAAL
jgi:small subunit ribosomal protein S20